MAEPAQEEQHDSDSESSEDLQRFREATWEVVPTTVCVNKSSYCGPEQPSLRFKADEHEQDGNELQTTPEFRAHVAKKLGAMLDSYICVSDAGKHMASNSKHAADSAEDGFRLFYSSIPGSSDVVQPSPRKRRPPSSSSDQDSEEEWQRCREAAISGTDILKHSAIPLPQQNACPGVSPERDTENRGKKKKKKRKKKKAKLEKTDTMDDVQNANGEQVPHGCISQDSSTSEGVSHKKKKKKKKKKSKSDISVFEEGLAGSASDGS